MIHTLISSISEEQLKDLYLNQQKTAPQIAEIYKCSTNQVKAMLNKFKLRKPKAMKCKSGKGDLLTKENLEKLYEAHNMGQIARIVGISAPAVRGHFLRKGIPINKKHGFQMRPVHPNSIRALLENKPTWEERSQKDKDAFRFSKSPGMLGMNHSKEARAKMSLSGAKRMARQNKKTKAELKAESILNNLGFQFATQQPIELIDNDGDIWGTCADFVLYDQPMETILFVDSRYHHNKADIRVHDEEVNYLLTKMGYLVLRLWDDEIDEDRVKDMLSHIALIETPSLLRYYYPEEYRKSCPKAYLRQNFKMVCTPFYEVKEVTRV